MLVLHIALMLFSRLNPKLIRVNTSFLLIFKKELEELQSVSQQSTADKLHSNCYLLNPACPN